MRNIDCFKKPRGESAASKETVFLKWLDQPLEKQGLVPKWLGQPLEKHRSSETVFPKWLANISLHVQVPAYFSIFFWLYLYMSIMCFPSGW